MVHYTLRIPDDLYQRVKASAERDRRSVNGEILRLIDRGLEVADD